MVERLFWHIGQPKTGTTYLQQILWANEDALAAQDISLPGGKHRWLLWAALDLAGAPGLAQRDKRAPGRWNRLVGEIRDSTASTAVISHEFFCQATAEQVAGALEQLEGIEVHVVVTARDAAGMLAAGWQEYVKNGAQASLQDMATREVRDSFGWWTWDLAGVLDRWTSALPADRVHVLPVQGKDAAADQHWKNFAEVIGYTGEVTLPEREVNSSLGVVQIEAMRQVNAHVRGMTSTDRGDWMRGYMAENRLSLQKSERVRLDDDLWEQCRVRSERAVEIIRSRGVHLLGDESRLLVPAAGPQGRRADTVTEAEKAEALAELTAQMIADLRDTDKERKVALKRAAKLEARIAELEAGRGPSTGSDAPQAGEPGPVVSVLDRVRRRISRR